MPNPTRVAARTAVFNESVIREMTRLALIHGAMNLAQGYPDFPRAPRRTRASVGGGPPHVPRLEGHGRLPRGPLFTPAANPSANRRLGGTKRSLRDTWPRGPRAKRHKHLHRAS